MRRGEDRRVAGRKFGGGKVGGQNGGGRDWEGGETIQHCAPLTFPPLSITVPSTINLPKGMNELMLHKLICVIKMMHVYGGVLFSCICT